MRIYYHQNAFHVSIPFDSRLSMFHIIHTTTSYPCVEKWETLTPALVASDSWCFLHHDSPPKDSSTDTLPTTKRAATGAPSEPPVSKKRHRTMLQVFASLNGDNGYKHRAVLAPIEYSDSE